MEEIALLRGLQGARGGREAVLTYWCLGQTHMPCLWGGTPSPIPGWALRHIQQQMHHWALQICAATYPEKKNTTTDTKQKQPLEEITSIALQRKRHDSEWNLLSGTFPILISCIVR